MAQTPGPWVLRSWLGVDDERGNAIASMAPASPFTIETIKANQRLIAAAPDLLAALEAAHAAMLMVREHMVAGDLLHARGCNPSIIGEDCTCYVSIVPDADDATEAALAAAKTP